MNAFIQLYKHKAYAAPGSEPKRNLKHNQQTVRKSNEQGNKWLTFFGGIFFLMVDIIFHRSKPKKKLDEIVNFIFSWEF